MTSAARTGVALMLDTVQDAASSEEVGRRFAAALEAHNVDAALALTSPEVVLHSPVVHRPYEGRDALGGILRAVTQIFEDFRYTAAYGADNGHVLAFAAGGRPRPPGRRHTPRRRRRAGRLDHRDGPALLGGHRAQGPND